MFANLRNIFNPQAIVQTFSTMPPLASTIMDMFFKQRPTHPMPLIALSELVQITRTVPLVRRDGTAISLGNDSLETQYIAPLPVKVKVNVSASELNDLRVIMQQPQAVEAWRKNKIEQIRKAARNTVEAMCTVVLNTGKVSWPVQLEGGRTETYEVDYGTIHQYSLTEKLSETSKLSDIYKILRDMDKIIKQGGIGGKISFMAGSDVVSVLLNLADASRTTLEKNPYRLELSEGKIIIGSYAIHFMDETYPDPLSSQWLPKLDPKTLLAVATEQSGAIYYCAIDSISANNAATAMHIVPVVRDDDSGITLIGQTKPLPVRVSKGTCRCIAVN